MEEWFHKHSPMEGFENYDGGDQLSIPTTTVNPPPLFFPPRMKERTQPSIPTTNFTVNPPPPPLFFPPPMKEQIQPSIPTTNFSVNPSPPLFFPPPMKERIHPSIPTTNSTANPPPPPLFSPIFSPPMKERFQPSIPTFNSVNPFSIPPNNSTVNPPPLFSSFRTQFVSPPMMEGTQLSTPNNSMNQESQCINSKFNSHEPLPRIKIDMKLATHILLDEFHKGSYSKNVVCSPLSLEFALQTVAAGSKGETLKQILQFIGFKGNQLDSMEDLNLKSSNIMRVASSFSTGPELSFGNGIWIDEFYKMKTSYKELMKCIYNSKAESVDFKKQAGQLARDINSWVADITKGLINNIVGPGSIHEDTILILVNALYFKGLWDFCSKFEETLTIDKDFYKLDGSKISCRFMSSYSSRNLYRAFNGFSVLQLDYGRGDDKLRKFCMQILLPDKRDGLQNLMDKCMSNPGFLNQDFGLTYEKFKEIRIPKFKFTYKHKNVQNMMKSLGLILPFDCTCEDLTEMVQLPHGRRLYVSNIFHEAAVEVNESGTKAAAVTKVDFLIAPTCSMNYKPPPPPTLIFVADHPFMFVIKELNTGAIFFIGAVFNPLLKD